MQWVMLSLILVGTTGCLMGPSEERLNCLGGCARGKDSCTLSATTASGIQQCDERSSSCNAGCPQ